MFSHRSFCIACAVFLLFGSFVFGQEEKNYVMVPFDERGKLEDPKAWAEVKKGLAKRKPDHVFVVAHGWRYSKKLANDTFSHFAELLRKQQGKNESIEVIGIRWRSLLGENEDFADELLKEAAKLIAGKIAKSEKLQERKDILKKYLKHPLTRPTLRRLFGVQLPDNKEIDVLIDNLEKTENIEDILTVLSYYQMQKRADVVGANGVQAWLTELQDALPQSRVHLVGHSFGCKVCLACLGSEERASRQVDSLTLLQGAVSMFCFAAKIDELENKPCGRYAHVPKRVKGCISITYTKNDDALRLAFVAASQAAGQVAELPGRKYQLGPSLYGALGAKGVTGVDGIPQLHMKMKGTVYKLGCGLHALNADEVIQHHTDICKEDVTWLIWSTARQQP